MLEFKHIQTIILVLHKLVRQIPLEDHHALLLLALITVNMRFIEQMYTFYP